MEQIPRSDFLFPKTSFLIGCGSVFDIWGGYYSFNQSAVSGGDDERALACDWAMVAEDLRAAVEAERLAQGTQMLLALS